MEATGHPQGIARRALAGAQYTLTASISTTPPIGVAEGASIGVRKISGDATDAEVHGRFEGDAAFSRARDLAGDDITVSLGSAVPLPPDIYMFAEIKLVADAVVFVGGKT